MTRTWKSWSAMAPNRRFSRRKLALPWTSWMPAMVSPIRVDMLRPVSTRFLLALLVRFCRVGMTSTATG